MDGINIKLVEDELVIKGNKDDLKELAKYINDIALSENEKDHIHLDELTIVSEKSNIKEIIIEKE